MDIRALVSCFWEYGIINRYSNYSYTNRYLFLGLASNSGPKEAIKAWLILDIPLGAIYMPSK
jgi:hypothetical protein